MRELRVVDYDPRWPAAYEAEAAEIRAALGDVVIQAHHIGSTAVPGLAAKPIIDILLEVPDLPRLDARDAAMRALGYEPRGACGIPGRRYYRKGGDARTHHVHAFVSGDTHIAEHIAFRDYLRAHPDVAAEYARIKREGAARHRHDSAGYTAFKHDFVRGAVDAAGRWAAWLRGGQQ